MEYKDIDLLTAKEFSFALGVHYNTTRKMIKKGNLKAFKIGSKGRTSDFRIPKSELVRLSECNIHEVESEILSKRKEEKRSNELYRFLKSVKKTPKCWLWISATTKSGYGVFCLNKKYIRAHRASFILFKGEIQKNMLVLHSCDIRNCVNPSHLTLGTHKDNMNDRKIRNRYVAAKGENCKVSKLTNDEVEKIRDLRKRNINAKEIAKMFNISKNYVYELQSGLYR